MPIGEKTPYRFEGLTIDVEPGDTAAVFTLPLEPGPIALHTWFRGAPAGRIPALGYDLMLSAYYVYVTRQ